MDRRTLHQINSEKENCENEPFDVNPKARARSRFVKRVPCVNLSVGSPLDPQSVIGFQTAITKTMRETEQNPLIAHIRDIDRAKTVNWLIKVHYQMRMSTATLYQAIKTFDYAITSDTADSMNLIAAASFLIASKMEEYFPPSLSVLSKAVGCPRSTLLSTESQVFIQTSNHLIEPIVLQFLTQYLRFEGATREDVYIARMICEAFHHTIEYSKYPPSIIACSSILLMHIKQNKSQWSDSMVGITGYKKSDITKVIKSVSHVLRNFDPSIFSGLRQKYQVDEEYLATIFLFYKTKIRYPKSRTQ